MDRPDKSDTELLARLDGILAGGMPPDPIEHARQVANVAAILHTAFTRAGFVVTLVGGSAIEIHAPGRHWRRGRDLFVEVVKGPLEGPAENVRVGDAEFRIVTKEVVLRDRVVGFKQWKYTGYGQQAIDMLAAFGDELDMSWLSPELEREDSLDALQALQRLAASQARVTDRTLRELIEQLHQRRSGS